MAGRSGHRRHRDGCSDDDGPPLSRGEHHEAVRRRCRSQSRRRRSAESRGPPRRMVPDVPKRPRDHGPDADEPHGRCHHGLVVQPGLAPIGARRSRPYLDAERGHRTHVEQAAGRTTRRAGSVLERRVRPAWRNRRQGCWHADWWTDRGPRHSAARVGAHRRSGSRTRPTSRTPTTTSRVRPSTSPRCRCRRC